MENEFRNKREGKRERGVRKIEKTISTCHYSTSNSANSFPQTRWWSFSSQKPATLSHPLPSAAPSHPFLSFPLSLSLARSLADAPKAPLNLAHRTNGLLYASAYTGTIPFYPERYPGYLSRRYLLSDRLTVAPILLHPSLPPRPTAPS